MNSEEKIEEILHSMNAIHIKNNFEIDQNFHKRKIINKKIKGFQKNTLKAFCSNQFCINNGEEYNVFKLGNGNMINCTIDQIYCPYCRYALFWSCYYKKLKKTYTNI